MLESVIINQTDTMHEYVLAQRLTVVDSPVKSRRLTRVVSKEAKLWNDINGTIRRERERIIMASSDTSRQRERRQHEGRDSLAKVQYVSTCLNVSHSTHLS
jgi:hypothetical protein